MLILKLKVFLLTKIHQSFLLTFRVLTARACSVITLGFLWARAVFSSIGISTAITITSLLIHDSAL